LSYSFRLDGHIKLEGVQKYFPPKLGRIVELSKHIAGILVFSSISFSAVYTVSTNFESKTPTISLPFWLFFLPTVIGFVLLTAAHVKALIRSIKSWK
jgi:TRAP-type C4-dicarboxylate transport system permease small subunit